VKRVGLVGAGYISEWHVSALRRIQGIEICAICDSNPTKAGLLAKKLGSLKAYTSVEQMIASEKLDVVHVLVPPDHHGKVARIALKAGVHVLLEKPMAIHEADCQELISLAKRNKVRLGVSHNYLSFPIYEKLKQDMVSGKLGRIDQIIITWNMELPALSRGPYSSWMFKSPGNIILDTGSHSVAHDCKDRIPKNIVMGPPSCPTLSIDLVN